MKWDAVLETLAAPARRALEGAGIGSLKELSKRSEAEVRGLHGLGPKALASLAAAMDESGLAFAGAEKGKAPTTAKAPGTATGKAAVDGFIAGYPPKTRRLLETMRKTIRAVAPGAGEKISYGIPTFYLNGNLVHFSGYEKHIGFYPGADGISVFGEELKRYKSAKGSVQFPIDEPLPLDLVERITRFRVGQNLAKKRR